MTCVHDAEDSLQSDLKPVKTCKLPSPVFISLQISFTCVQDAERQISFTCVHDSDMQIRFTCVHDAEDRLQSCLVPVNQISYRFGSVVLPTVAFFGC